MDNMAIDLGKRQLVDSIWKSAGIEGLGTTFPNTEKILDNLPVNTTREEVFFIVNMKRAWDFLFDHILEAFCYVARTQMFLDGNKRAAQLICNKILMEHDIGICSVPYQRIDEFKRLLVDFYGTDDPSKLKDFLKTECLLVRPSVSLRQEQVLDAERNTQTELDTGNHFISFS